MAYFRGAVAALYQGARRQRGLEFGDLCCDAPAQTPVAGGGFGGWCGAGGLRGFGARVGEVSAGRRACGVDGGPGGDGQDPGRQGGLRLNLKKVPVAVQCCVPRGAQLVCAGLPRVFGTGGSARSSRDPGRCTASAAPGGGGGTAGRRSRWLGERGHWGWAKFHVVHRLGGVEGVSAHSVGAGAPAPDPGASTGRAPEAHSGVP